MQFYNKIIENLKDLTHNFSSFRLKTIRQHSYQERLDLRTVSFANAYFHFRSCFRSYLHQEYLTQININKSIIKPGTDHGTDTVVLSSFKMRCAISISRMRNLQIWPKSCPSLNYNRNPNQWRHGLGAKPPKCRLAHHRETYTGQESGGELCKTFKFWSILQSKSVNNVCKPSDLLGYSP